MNYYNEFDPKAAAWLQQLIDDKQIPNGHVDSRSITEVQPSDLAGFSQCHFFAGIGGWSLALRLAGWPEDRPVWTGSCPCQPFSVCGKRTGFDDHRHLWPEFKRLIEACNPPTVFGEQVSSKEGRVWLQAVFDDLENIGYEFAGADLCSAWAGAPHLRKRLYFAANPVGFRGEGQIPSVHIGEVGPRWPSSPEDMFRIVDAPFEQGNSHPKPLLRSLDDGVSGAVDLLRGFGNAITPQVAALFITSYREATE